MRAFSAVAELLVRFCLAETGRHVQSSDTSSPKSSKDTKNVFAAAAEHRERVWWLQMSFPSPAEGS